MLKILTGIIREKKNAAAAFAAGVFMLTLGQLIYALSNPSYHISNYGISGFSAAATTVTLVVLGALLVLVSLYLWMRPVTLKKFAKEAGLLVLTACILILLFGGALGLLSMLMRPSTSAAARYVIDTLALIGGLALSAYLIGVVARMIAEKIFVLRVSKRTYALVLMMITGSCVVQILMGYLPTGLISVAIRSVITAVVVTAVLTSSIEMVRREESIVSVSAVVEQVE